MPCPGLSADRERGTHSVEPVQLELCDTAIRIDGTGRASAEQCRDDYRRRTLCPAAATSGNAAADALGIGNVAAWTLGLERDQYSWASGHYVERPSPSANWTPGYWQQGPAGWTWTNGYWS